MLRLWVILLALPLEAAAGPRILVRAMTTDGADNREIETTLATAVVRLGQFQIAQHHYMLYEPEYRQIPRAKRNCTGDVYCLQRLRSVAKSEAYVLLLTDTKTIVFTHKNMQKRRVASLDEPTLRDTLAELFAPIRKLSKYMHRIHVRSNAPGEVIIDGETVGSVPEKKWYSVREGEHQLTVHSDRCKAQIKLVNINGPSKEYVYQRCLPEDHIEGTRPFPGLDMTFVGAGPAMLLDDGPTTAAAIEMRVANVNGGRWSAGPRFNVALVPQHRHAGVIASMGGGADWLVAIDHIGDTELRIGAGLLGSWGSGWNDTDISWGGLSPLVELSYVFRFDSWNAFGQFSTGAQIIVPFEDRVSTILLVPFTITAGMTI